jgi:hypothetical protein
MRVEEYWQRKGAAWQHYAVTFYGGAPEDEFDALRDEVRTLRVKLNQVQTRPPSSVPMMQMQAQEYANLDDIGSVMSGPHLYTVPLNQMHESRRSSFYSGLSHGEIVRYFLFVLELISRLHR